MGSKLPPSTTSSSHVHFADKTLAGVPGLLTDLRKLINDKESADLVFVVGPEAVHFHAHKLILWARCSSFRRVGREFWGASSSHKESPGPGQGNLFTVKYPFFDAEVFREVLVYIYTGKIILQNLTIFSVLAVAQELGVSELEESCRQHITASLAPPNAAAFFAAALQVEKERHSTDFYEPEQRFSEICRAYVEENADQVVRTEGWLDLPKEAVIQLLNSDNFALEEEEVWRASLRWAKHHAGVPPDRPPVAWNDHEKSLVSQALSGVIQHVKLLLIDSTVFAEEVEPTGAVPIELSLERYRYAAVPDKFSQSEDRRLHPRVSHKLFQGTQILINDKLKYQRQLNAWFSESKQIWRMLYRASRDGATAEDFHKHCDGVSPTYVIILGTTGNICGGFSDVPWTSNTSNRGRFIASDKAFLFTLVNNQGVSASRFNVVIPQYATCHHPNYGPMFGAGSDLCVAGNSQSGMECYSNMPHSYDGEGASSSILMGDYNFNILDYEVFTTYQS